MPGADRGGETRRARWTIPPASDGVPLDRALRGLMDGSSWNRVRRLIETGKVLLDGATVRDPARLVRADQTIEVVPNAPRAPLERGALLAPDALVYADTDVVVVHKPAGMSTVPYDESERVTLDRLTADLLAKRERGRRAPLGIVHRLDKETTGLVLFARTLGAKRDLKNQFRFHTVQRRYWAIAHGRVPQRTITSRLVQDRGDGLRGSTENPILGRVATTHVTPLRKFESATLVECRLETGRTHQIRIHLAEAGHPVLGERVYVRGYRGAILPAPRVMLHAFELGFAHPKTGAPLHFEAAMPADMEACLRKLR